MIVENCGRYYHIYKGVEIEKVEKHYAQGNERYYRIGNEIFDRLKDAKHYIDVTLVTTDYTAYGGKNIVLSDDNEGNGYHGLFYGFTPVNGFEDDIYDSCTSSADDTIILG